MGRRQSKTATLIEFVLLMLCHLVVLAIPVLSLFG